MKQLTAFLLLLTLFTSCVTSIHPLSENGSGVVKDDRLPGHWMDSASRMEAWVIPDGSFENKDFHYNITVYEPNKDKDQYKDTSFLEGRLVKLDNEYFLDVSIAENNPQSVNAGRTFVGFLLPQHQFFKLDISKNSIAMLYMDHDKLKRLVRLERFLKAVNKVVQARRQETTTDNAEAFISLKADKKVYRVAVGDILHLEALGDYVRVTTNENQYVVNETLRDLLQQLPPKNFLRVHKSFAVAKNRISFLEGNYIRVGSRDIPIGATYREEVLAQLK